MKKIIFIFILLILLTLPCLAQTAKTPAPRDGVGVEAKIAIVHASAFNCEISEISARIDTLSAEVRPKRKEIETYQKQVEDIKNKLQIKNSAVDEAIRNQWIERGQELEKTIKQKSEAYEAFLQKRGEELIQPVQQKILAALKKYAIAHGIAIVLDGDVTIDNILVTSLDWIIDITDDFIKEYNQANEAEAGSSATNK